MTNYTTSAMMEFFPSTVLIYIKAEAPREFVLSYWMEILSLVFALVGLVGNSIVLWLLGFRTQRSPFSVYILNLAAADALLLGNYFGYFMCKIVGNLKSLVLKLLWRCILNLSYSVGLSLLAVISTERCLSVLFPIWYRHHRPKHTSACVCAILWALQGLFWGVFVALHFLIMDHLSDLYFVLYLVQFGWFLLLTCVLCVSSLTLVLRVQCSSKCRHPPRFYLLVLLTALVFLLCGLPLGIFYVVRFFSGSRLIPYKLCRLLACVNSSSNPFIYFFLGSQWCKRGREPLRVVLQRALGEEQVLGDGTRDTSQPDTLDELS
ncbi:mas-related G-protein coupled receptor member X4-like [Monodelphis domestica]|uniref:mas-related G-protein coupled receptor member X4-like n=1 Tax=Monodelphis domestica TaxID=13616 RepID=UPI00020F6973|nr:mas-related G-protein coupled receptor member X4-like [Monodelphis domestica]